MPAEALLHVEALRVAYDTPRGRVQSVDGVSLSVAAGNSLGIVGESGAGKSQIGLAVLGLLPEHAQVEGRIVFDGLSLLEASRRQRHAVRGAGIGMVFQDPGAALNPYRRIGAQLVETLQVHGVSGGRRAAKAEALRLLDAVRMPQAERRLRSYPFELSGGQRQRVMIALALAAKPRLLIADEPTTALDVTVQAGILKLLDALRVDLGLALVLVSHDLGIVAEHCDDTVVLYAGRVVEQGPTAALIHAPQHPYTHGLLAARPKLDGDPSQPLAQIPGSPPNPLQLPPGCAFSPRCQRATAQCDSVPVLSGQPPHSFACHHPLGG